MLPYFEGEEYVGEAFLNTIVVDQVLSTRSEPKKSSVDFFVRSTDFTVFRTWEAAQ